MFYLVALLRTISLEGNLSHSSQELFQSSNGGAKTHKSFSQKEKKIKTLPLSSVDQSCLTLCDPMDCSMPGLPVHRQLPEFTQTHVHRVDDAIQPSHPLGDL